MGIKSKQFVLAAISSSFGPLAMFAPKALWLPIVIFLLIEHRSLSSLNSHNLKLLFRQNGVFLIIPFYALISAFWTLVPSDALVTGAKLLVYLILMLAVAITVDRLSNAEKRQILAGVSAGIVIAALIVWMEVATGGAISSQIRTAVFTPVKFSGGAAVASCAFLPAAVGLYRYFGKWPVIIFTAVCTATIFLLDNEAAKLAFSASVLVFGTVRWWKRLFWPVILLPLAIGAIFPALFLHGFSNGTLCKIYNYKPSAAHRLVIYEFTSQRIAEKPVFGWGMDASRSIPGGNALLKIDNCSYRGQQARAQIIYGLLPLHPHNASLQIWLELGVAGIVLSAGLLILLIVRCQRSMLQYETRPLVAGLFSSIFLIYNIGFGLWQSWLIFGLIIVCATVRSIRHTEQTGFADTNQVPTR